MAKYKGLNAIVISEHLHDDNDYVNIETTNNKGEKTSDRVKKSELKPEHTEQLSKHVPLSTVKDTFHPKFIQKDKK
jgi:hypothetical protein